MTGDEPGVDSYLTVATDHAHEIAVRRSRFLCRVVRVPDEDGARAVVAAQRRAHPAARHHCSAFVLGPDGRLRRSSDDGEPAGTAGAPMLEVLVGAGVSDVVAVVTRYFGGVLLGAGGLVRAYSDAVRECLHGAGTVRRRLARELAVTVEHAAAGRLEHDLRARGTEVTGVDYADRATVRLSVPVADVAGTQRFVAEHTGGAGQVRLGDQVWVDESPS